MHKLMPSPWKLFLNASMSGWNNWKKTLWVALYSSLRPGLPPTFPAVRPPPSRRPFSLSTMADKITDPCTGFRVDLLGFGSDIGAELAGCTASCDALWSSLPGGLGQRSIITRLAARVAAPGEKIKSFFLPCEETPKFPLLNSPPKVWKLHPKAVEYALREVFFPSF